MVIEGNPLHDAEGHHVAVLPNRGDGGLLDPVAVNFPPPVDPQTGKPRPPQYNAIGGTAYAGGNAALLAASTADLSNRPLIGVMHTVEGGVLGDAEMYGLSAAPA